MYLKIIKVIRVFSLAFIFLSVPVLSFAQSDILIDLSRETHAEVKIAVMEFTPLKGSEDPADLSEEGREILENDLRLFELFQPLRQSVFSRLEEMQAKENQILYNEWHNLGVQWLIKTEYQVHAPTESVSFVFRLYDIVNERFLVGKRYNAKRQSLRKIMHRFADEVMSQLTGKPGVAETRIGFLAKSGAGKELFLVDFDGFNVEKVTDENAAIMSPDWSPDGRAIVYTSFKERNPDLVMIDTLGMRRKSLLRLRGLNSAPSWSPDGEKIALVLSKDQNSEVYVLDRFANLNRLTRHFNIDTSPCWSPDGSQIAFTSDRSGTGRPQVYIMDASSGDQGGVTRVSFDSSYNDDPSWSPDGDKIAFTAQVSGVFQIRIYDLVKRETIDFTSGPGNKENPTWSPDGRFLAYSVSKHQRAAIHIKRLGGRKSRQLTFLSQGGFSPSWSPYLKR